jgi:hypothetical protein
MTFWPHQKLTPAAFNRILDWVERSVVLILFAYFVLRLAPRLAQLLIVQVNHPELILPAAGISAQAALLIVSELLSVILILARRPSPSLSSYPFDWALCFLAITLPLPVTPTPAGTLLPAEAATALMLIGLMIQIAVKTALWRSFGIVPANRASNPAVHTVYCAIRCMPATWSRTSVLAGIHPAAQCTPIRSDCCHAGRLADA